MTPLPETTTPLPGTATHPPGTTTPPPRHRDRAGQLSDLLTERLLDPVEVAALAGVPGAPASEPLAWGPVSLGRGHAGLAVLCITRSNRHPGFAVAAHRHLSRATDLLGRSRRPSYGIVGEITGLAFGMEMAHRVTGGYTGALASLDRTVAQHAARLCRDIEQRPIGGMARYDAIEGLAGMGRYMLLRGDTLRAPLEEVLATLVRMAGTVSAPSGPLPGLWCDGPPSLTARVTPDVEEHGHLNLGLAHGIAGPLALLSVAFREGVRVQGQHRAASAIVSRLRRAAYTDAYGVGWADYVSREQWLRGTPVPASRRAAWCYAAPGVSRAVQLAGDAFGEPGWTELAEDSVRAVVRAPIEEWRLRDQGLCHGTAGMLTMLRFFADGPLAELVVPVRDTLVEMLLSAFDPERPFGYVVPVRGSAAGGDYPGLLEGAAGIALALDTYAGPEPRVPWEAALMVV
ncbi:lanthionine synthetase C family protein [Streptomyces sp. NRRL S-118]|uniref:lanthionine synthetase C family protein n=1 Tax=Streptomyces sp. NRRL S-118 TaxID=1463881 RepID=UPI0006945712|nr:lanthionine synthetase C family protein [Streptomyces sp. NRRL S-118]